MSFRFWEGYRVELGFGAKATKDEPQNVPTELIF